MVEPFSVAMKFMVATVIRVVTEFMVATVKREGSIREACYMLGFNPEPVTALMTSHNILNPNNTPRATTLSPH
jgi:hypothetical protein